MIVIAKLVLKDKGIDFKAFVSQVGDIKLDKAYTELDLTKIEDNEEYGITAE